MIDRIEFTPSHIEDENNKLSQRMLGYDALFLLLLGPSAVGKTQIMRQLLARQAKPKFSYISPVMTRALRDGETDKVSVSSSEFDTMQANGAFIVVNEQYETRYGTPLSQLQEATAEGRVPLLDYPLQKLRTLDNSGYNIVTAYVYPPSLSSLRERITKSGRLGSGRFEAGLEELELLAARNYIHPDIDISVVNQDGSSDLAAQQIVARLQKTIVS